MIGLSGPTLSNVQFCLAFLAELLILGSMIFGHGQTSSVTFIIVVVQAMCYCRDIVVAQSGSE